MKYLVTLIMVFAAWSSSAESANNPFEGNIWSISIVQNYVENPSPACIVFHPGGRFTMSDRTLTMLWKPHPLLPHAFSAVTSPGERTVVPTHLGVHGFLAFDKTLYGSGIDLNGSVFQFEGRPAKDCRGTGFDTTTNISAAENRALIEPGLVTVSDETANVNQCSESGCVKKRNQAEDNRALIDPGSLTVTNETANLHSCSQPGCASKSDSALYNRTEFDVGLLTVENYGTLVDPCSISWCAPPDYLLRTLSFNNAQRASMRSANHKPSSVLANRLFRFSLGDDTGRFTEHCWYFRDDGFIDSHEGEAVVWAPDSILTSASHGFRSVGVAPMGHGMAVQGVLIANDRIYVQGINAFNGKAVMHFGFGIETEDCVATDEYY